MVACSLTDPVPRLSRHVLAQPAAANIPKIVHLGLGAFARAHLAEYVRRVNEQEPDDPWFICGVSLRNPDVRDALAPQDGLYTIIERDGPRDNPTDRFILCDSVSEVLFADDDGAIIQARLIASETQIISMTVTEKGYCRGADGTLDTDNEDVARDIRALKETPGAIAKTLPGWLAQALVARCSKDLPVTMISLDNLPNNGMSLKQVVSEMLQHIDGPTARWVGEGNVTFPSTVIDRIVPATSDEDRHDVAAHLKFRDSWPVATEPYTNWVLEDRFCSAQPDWAAAGVTLVADATPFEDAKLRLLNGPHSFIAYLGQLTDRETVADVMADPNAHVAVQRFMVEATQTVNTPATFVVAAYQKEILSRFHNPALRHRTAQIAMDGSEKIPQRWLTVIEKLRQQGRPVRFLAGALAVWMRYLEGKSESGRMLEISDPRAEQLTRIATEMSDPGQALVAVLTLLQSSLAEDKTLIDDVTRYYRDLVDLGAASLLRELINRG